MWWRPPFLKQIDALCGLDRKSLPFSYLVIAKSPRTRAELLPEFAATSRHRLVSPSHVEGKDLEFYTCGEDGKRRTKIRYRKKHDDRLERGSILMGAELEDETHASRVVNDPKAIL